MVILPPDFDFTLPKLQTPFPLKGTGSDEEKTNKLGYITSIEESAKSTADTFSYVIFISNFEFSDGI